MVKECTVLLKNQYSRGIRLVSVFGQNYMGMNEVASSILPMLETVIQGDETEVAGPRSLIWVWSVATLKVSEKFFQDDVERRDG